MSLTAALQDPQVISGIREPADTHKLSVAALLTHDLIKNDLDNPAKGP